MAIIATYASLRIFGQDLDFGLIERSLGLPPSHVHRKGDINKVGQHPYAHDMWSVDSGLGKTATLEEHLERLRAMLSPHYDFLRSLKSQVTVDLYLGYTSDTDQAGFEISPESLDIFRELAIPLSVGAILGLGAD